VSLALLAGCGGGKAQDPDWYYHFACNGDSACLTTNPLPNGTAFGTIDEGPVESSCRALQEFRRRFWGTVSWDDCDHCPSCLPPGYGQPTVTGVSPPSEAPGGQVTITGTSFPALASQLEIDVAGAATITTMTPGATISTSGYTTITFTIPPNTPSATGPITVHTPGGVVTWAGPFTVRNDLAAVAWTGAQFVAVGKNASALTSADGTSGWTAHPTGQNPLAVSFTSVASLGGHLLAGGTNARILGSSDGAAWSVVAIPVGGTYSWNGLAYSGTTYVAVGMGGGLATSPDGTTWTSRAFGLTSDNYYGATWASGKFVAIGGGIATSPDASTWTRQVAIGVQNNAVAWSGSAFVAVGSGGAVKTSPDGVTWTTQSSGASANLRGVTWFNGAFIAVGDSGTILTSPDGVTWTARTSGVTLTLNAVAASPTRAVAVGAAGTILWSPDGAAWFAVGLPAPTGVYAAPGQGPGGAPRIHWSAVPGAADYAVYGAAGATVSRTSYQAFSYTTATSADPIGLPSGQPGAWWSFIVVARNGLGESQPSAIVTACVGNTACP
jgi:hypothetical protein